MVLLGCGASAVASTTLEPVETASVETASTPSPPAVSYLYVQESIALRDRRTVSGVRLRFAPDQHQLDLEAIERLEENLKTRFPDDTEYEDDDSYLSALEDALCGDSGVLDASLRIGATIDVLGPRGWSETRVQQCEVELEGWTRFLTLVLDPSTDVLLAAQHQESRPPAHYRAVEEVQPCSSELWVRVSPTIAELGRFDVRGCGVLDLPGNRRVVQVGMPMVAPGRELSADDWSEVPESCGRHMGCEGAAILLVDAAQVTVLHGNEEDLVHENWSVLGTFVDGTDVGVVSGNYMLGQDHLVITRLRDESDAPVQELLHHYESGG